MRLSVIHQINKLRYLASALVILSSELAIAQIEIPKNSPRATVSQAVGISNATIEYSRPSVKGRKIFGDLVPYEKVWRTGANKCTVIKLDDDMYVNGTLVKAGSYGLYTIPNKTEWIIILNTDDVQVGSFNYDANKDVLRFKTKPALINPIVEQMEIRFEKSTLTSAIIGINFENTGVKFKVEQFPDEKIMAEIKEKTASPDAKIETLVRAAEYYYDQNRNLQQALAWAKKILETETGYFFHHLVAKIASKMGECKLAADHGSIALEGATIAGDIAFVKLSKIVLEECEKK